jgi:hypothetical protein
MGDHVHILDSILPKYAVSQVVAYIKGKSSIHIARTYAGYRNNFIGWNFWARGYFVLAVGRDGDTIRKYIKRQKEAGKRIDPLKLFCLCGAWSYNRFERFTNNPTALPEVTMCPRLVSVILNKLILKNDFISSRYQINVVKKQFHRFIFG